MTHLSVCDALVTIAEDRDLPEWKSNAIEDGVVALKALYAALNNFVAEYVDFVDSGDAGFWDAEQEGKVKAARAALALARGELGCPKCLASKFTCDEHYALAKTQGER